MDEIAYWLALQRAPGVGPVAFAQLLEHYGSPAEVFAAAPVLGETAPAAFRDYLRQPDWSTVEPDLRWLEHDHHHILTLHDPAYPPLLRQIADAPPVLFVRGDPAPLCAPQLAMVGSRNPSPGGRETAHAFARQLAGAGLVITSGLALGIDAASHRGALAAGGTTIAVAGTGLDRVYPASHHKLALEICAHGALVSEYPIGTRPAPGNFPRRNRIITGLSLGTLVVEAGLAAAPSSAPAWPATRAATCSPSPAPSTTP